MYFIRSINYLLLDFNYTKSTHSLFFSVFVLDKLEMYNFIFFNINNINRTHIHPRYIKTVGNVLRIFFVKLN